MIPAVTKHRGISTTFDPAKTQANNTLSNGNLTLSSTTNSSSTSGTQSTVSRNSGKRYVEFTINAAHAGAGYQNQVGIGLCDSNCNGSNSTATNYSWGSWDSGYILQTNSILTSAVGTFTNGDIVGMTVDFTASPPRITWYKNNVSTVSQDATGFTTSFVFAWANSASGTAQVTVNFGATSFTYTPPTGYSAWG